MNVLVVDDEKLVRAGFIALMPWDKFGMKVAGEAANGEKALEFLSANPVDLVITDLAMPVLSGLELMHVMKERHPDIPVVVLTFHQDFELVQEALRLGAIDYIAKVELEKEQLEQVLGRIKARIGKERQRGGMAQVSLSLETLAIAYYIGKRGGKAAERPAHMVAEAQELDDGVWYVPLPEYNKEGGAVSIQQALGREWTVLGFERPCGIERDRLGKAARRFRETGLFYLSEPERRVYRVDPEAWLAEAMAEPETVALQSSLQRSWTDWRWLRDDEAYAKLLRETEDARLPAIQTRDMLLSSLRELRTFGVAGEAAGLEPDLERMTDWSGCVDMLDGIRRRYQAAFLHSGYSSEVVESVAKAIRYVEEHLEEDFSLVDVAVAVNLSRSYFSQCFRDMVGKPFVEYVRAARMERAKRLLESTDKPIYWVAERSGYADEKYFSKVFRSQYGLLPREYRSRYIGTSGETSSP
ncbi:hypothetical protein B1748_21815 [Paenibacillus sp. MY03]|uniref:response regulator n=1 Tax=Paenibacillus sp. MY03 TaxID=302980 RepID=UPI000B3BEF07|nr:response regulator [Paenibacillus sp. MY03]OUS73982.1 hypothetical protein B1748_21815 [Paenibacillus sp. MY03]